MPITPPTDSLTSLAKVKRFVGIESSDTSKDDLINELIGEVTQMIKSYCGREFLSTTYTEVYDTKHGRRKIFLRQIPVTSITSVKYRSGTPTSTVWVTYDANGYLTYLEGGYIHFYGALPEIQQGIQVVYTAGYLIDWTNEFSATHTLPEDLSIAANKIIGNCLNQGRASGISSESTEGQSITYDVSKAFSDDVKQILDAYKVVKIAR